MSQPSQRLLELIASFESFKPQAYICPGGKWTVGFGTTAIDGVPVVRGTTLDRAAAWTVLSEQVAQVMDDVRAAVKWDPPEQVLDALTSLTYNIGIGRFLTSTCLKRLNSGGKSEATIRSAAAALQWFIRARDPKTGQLRRLGGLIARRKAEADVMIAGWDGTAGGSPVDITAPEPTVLGTRRVQGVLVAGGGGLVAVLPQVLPVLLDGSQPLPQRLLTLASQPELVTALVGILGGVGGVIWSAWDDLRHGAFGSQGRSI